MTQRPFELPVLAAREPVDHAAAAEAFEAGGEGIAVAVGKLLGGGAPEGSGCVIGPYMTRPSGSVVARSTVPRKSTAWAKYSSQAARMPSTLPSPARWTGTFVISVGSLLPVVGSRGVSSSTSVTDTRPRSCCTRNGKSTDVKSPAGTSTRLPSGNSPCAPEGVLPQCGINGVPSRSPSARGEV